jgi:hypothetical protein
MWTEGLLYLEAARTLTPSDKNHHFRSPTLQLAAHGIELALKSFLRAHKYSLHELQKLGHELVAIAAVCEAQGMTPLGDSVDRVFFEFMSDAHVDQEFRYVHLDRPAHVHCDDWNLYAKWALNAAIEAVASTEKDAVSMQAAMLRRLATVQSVQG